MTGTVRECERCREKVATREYKVVASTEEIQEAMPYMKPGVHWLCEDCIKVVTWEEDVLDD